MNSPFLFMLLSIIRPRVVRTGPAGSSSLKSIRHILSRILSAIGIDIGGGHVNRRRPGLFDCPKASSVSQFSTGSDIKYLSIDR